MFIASIPNRKSPPCILLRESYREGGKVRTRTLANVTHWPPEVVAGLRALLKGGVVIDTVADGFDVVRSLPHGHVAAVLGTLRKLRLDKLIASRRCGRRDLAVAMIVARIIDPRSKLAMSRGLGEETAWSTLGEELDIVGADENELYDAMDWLFTRQERIESALAQRHLRNGTLVLYDVTSSYFEGRKCPLAQYGHNRDGKKGKLQIVFGLLCDVHGRPIAVEVFEGDTGDPSTLGSQIRKIRSRFALERVVLVGDRGMITEARLRDDIRAVKGLDWITSLRSKVIARLVKEGSLQLSLFDERDLGEITSPEYPGERLIVCRNPFLAEERRTKRAELLCATEGELEKIMIAVSRKCRPLRGKDKIALRVGKTIDRFKVGKHFRLFIGEDSFRYERDRDKIAAEAALDGIYVIRTSVDSDTLDAEQTVRAYKALSNAERAFRSLKTVDLKVRPIHHRLADRVRAHVLLCMLAYYVEWHMRQALAPMLFDDDEKAIGDALRRSVVAPAQRSPRALSKAASKRTRAGHRVHSFQTLLADLATIAKHRIQPRLPGAGTFEKVTRPTPLQKRALRLLRLRL